MYVIFAMGNVERECGRESYAEDPWAYTVGKKGQR